MSAVDGFVLVLGGQRSGKSSYAAARVAAGGAPVAVITPAAVRDEEFAARVAVHQAERPPQWRTIEGFDLIAAMHQAGSGTAVLIDALDTWLAETLMGCHIDLGDGPVEESSLAAAERVVTDRLDAFLEVVRDRSGQTVLIAGQPGLGVHAAGRGARAYVDAHGRAVQRLSRAADEAVLLVGGRPLALGPPLPVDEPPPAAVVHAPAPVPPALRAHGDTQVPEGTVDLAVNVLPGPPDWLATDLATAVGRLATYPDDRAALAAAAARHGRPPDECLVLPGAAEAFWALPQVLRPRLAACVHPSFTEPEAALRAAGVPVVQVFRDPRDGWALDVAAIPADADLVVVARPDNPTGTVDHVETIAALCRPGRTVLVDEAFAEFLPDAGGLADRRDLPGLVSVRSLTKLWGLAGLRVGYMVGPSELIERLAADRQPWAVSTPALVAIERLAGAEQQRQDRAGAIGDQREELVALLRDIDGLTVWDSGANFVLLRSRHPDLRAALLTQGLAVRRGDTFPGLDASYVRVAVRDLDLHRRLAGAITRAFEEHR